MTDRRKSGEAARNHRISTPSGRPTTDNGEGTHAEEMVVEADVGDSRASGDPSTVLSLLDRVDRHTVDYGLDET